MAALCTKLPAPFESAYVRPKALPINVDCVVTFVVVATLMVAGPLVAFPLPGDRMEPPLRALKKCMQSHNNARTVVLSACSASSVGPGLGVLLGEAILSRVPVLRSRDRPVAALPALGRGGRNFTARFECSADTKSESPAASTKTGFRRLPTWCSIRRLGPLDVSGEDPDQRPRAVSR